MSQQFSLQNNNLAHSYNHQNESCLKLGVYTPLCEMAAEMEGSGHNFSFNKIGKLCKKSCVLLAIQQAYMRKLLDWTKNTSSIIFEWYPSLFPK